MFETTNRKLSSVLYRLDVLLSMSCFAGSRDYGPTISGVKLVQSYLSDGNQHDDPTSAAREVVSSEVETT